MSARRRPRPMRSRERAPAARTAKKRLASQGAKWVGRKARPRQRSIGPFGGGSLTKPKVLAPVDARLTVQLVPRPLWYTSNVRSILPKEDWDTLRRIQYRRSNWVCDFSGGRGSKWPLECHEVWEYDDQALVQHLLRLTGLCPACHESKHIGRAGVVGRGEEARAHLREVNGWTKDQTDAYVDAAFDKWAKRSRRRGWRLLIDWDVIASEYRVPLSLHGVIEYPARHIVPRGSSTGSP